MIEIGGVKPNALYVGANAVSRIYQGDTLVWGDDGEYNPLKCLIANAQQYITLHETIENGTRFIAKASPISKKNFNTVYGTNLGSRFEVYFSSSGTMGVYGQVKLLSQLNGDENTTISEAELLSSMSQWFIAAYDKVTTYNFGGMLWYIEVYRQDGSVMHDFQPVLRKSDGVAGMLDTVTGIFYAAEMENRSFGYVTLDGVTVEPT